MRKWPIPGKPRAWAPPGERGAWATAVPLYPQDKRLGWQDYLTRLQVRIDWMASKTPDPAGTLDRVWEDCTGRTPYHRDDDLSRLAEESDVMEALSNVQGVSSSMFPMEVENQPEAVDSIQEIWHLHDWALNLLPGREA